LHVLFATLAKHNQHVENDTLGRFHHASCGRYAGSFAKHFDNPRGLIQADSHTVELLGFLGPRLAAQTTTISGSAFRGFAILLNAFMLTVEIYHSEKLP
jgi:hypothetical protein